MMRESSGSELSYGNEITSIGEVQASEVWAELDAGRPNERAQFSREEETNVSTSDCDRRTMVWDEMKVELNKTVNEAVC